jgi:hypothetical protein
MICLRAWAENDHDVKKPERARDDDEHIEGGNAAHMVPQEGPPSRGGGLGSPNHKLGHGGLADADSEFEEFTVDPRRTPQRVGLAHLPDQDAEIMVDRRSAAPAQS